MGKTDKRIDQYILNAADFAQPILNHLRQLVHVACPEVEETMKWSFPHFQYEGEILCSMASFKKHCSFGFWKASLLSDPKKVLQLTGKTAMGSLGQITSMKDLPSDKVLVSYIREAAKLNETGAKTAPKPKIKKPDMPVPEDLLQALKKKPEAGNVFCGFSPGNRREYVEWITGAKTEETRRKRLQTAIEWMSEGKIRNWKYLKVKDSK